MVYRTEFDTFMELVRDELHKAYKKHGDFGDDESHNVNIITEEFLEFVTKYNDFINSGRDNRLGDQAMNELVQFVAMGFKFYQRHGAIRNGRIPCFWASRDRKDPLSNDTD